MLHEQLAEPARRDLERVRAVLAPRLLGRLWLEPALTPDVVADRLTHGHRKLGEGRGVVRRWFSSSGRRRRQQVRALAELEVVLVGAVGAGRCLAAESYELRAAGSWPRAYERRIGGALDRAQLERAAHRERPVAREEREEVRHSNQRRADIGGKLVRRREEVESEADGVRERKRHDVEVQRAWPVQREVRLSILLLVHVTAASRR